MCSTQVSDEDVIDRQLERLWFPELPELRSRQEGQVAAGETLGIPGREPRDFRFKMSGNDGLVGVVDLVEKLGDLTVTSIRSSLSEDGQVVTVKTVGDVEVSAGDTVGLRPRVRSWCSTVMEKGSTLSVKEAPQSRSCCEASGVSPSTVSRILNNTAKVSDRKKETVLRVIEETGFRPNLAARPSQGGRAMSTGV